MGLGAAPKMRTRPLRGPGHKGVCARGQWPLWVTPGRPSHLGAGLGASPLEGGISSLNRAFFGPKRAQRSYPQSSFPSRGHSPGAG